MKIMYINANGIRGKVKSLKTAIGTDDIEIVTIVETKLQGPPPRIDGFSWITKNRSHGQGGGVAILIKK